MLVFTAATLMLKTILVLASIFAIVIGFNRLALSAYTQPNDIVEASLQVSGALLIVGSLLTIAIVLS